MSITVFRGPAGSGKTTRLIKELSVTLRNKPLEEHQKVLALTRMHGSRLRLEARLRTVEGLCQRYDCLTVDSFAWRVLRRWRSLARSRFGAPLPPRAYAETCKRAGFLLGECYVANWVTDAYPFLVIDELQDSRNGQLEIIKALSRSSVCLAAIDPFQDLDDEGENPAASWVYEEGDVITLNQIHRTSVSGLLAAAEALRSEKPVPKKAACFRILPAYNSNVGASFVANQLTWYDRADVAVITPVRKENAPFVEQLIERVESGPIGKNQTGPYRIRWEQSMSDKLDDYLEEMQLPEDENALINVTGLDLPDSGFSPPLAEWFSWNRRVRGVAHLRAGEVREKIQRIHEVAKSWRSTHQRGVRAMTIHQAKNREFNSVIVLWPYEASGSSERLRRLLYNAVTRAKNRALVVVQNPDRLNEPPFRPN